MPDEIDQAQESAERALEMLIHAPRRSDQPRPTGFCHFCAEAIADGLPFCGPECRDDWQREQRLLARAGRFVPDD